MKTTEMTEHTADSRLASVRTGAADTKRDSLDIGAGDSIHALNKQDVTADYNPLNIKHQLNLIMDNCHAAT